MKRFWLAVARFAVRRVDGYVLRPYMTDAQWTTASTSSATNVSVTWKPIQ